LTESVEQVEVLGDGKDEELVLAKFSEQNVVNIIDTS